MRLFTESDLTRQRIMKWVMSAQPVDKDPTWTERRQAIVFGEHTYILQNDQVFACPHCGRYDPQWKASEVIAFFAETFGIKPIEVDVECTVNLKKD